MFSNSEKKLLIGLIFIIFVGIFTSNAEDSITPGIMIIPFEASVKSTKQLYKIEAAFRTVIGKTSSIKLYKETGYEHLTYREIISLGSSNKQDFIITGRIKKVKAKFNLHLFCTDINNTSVYLLSHSTNLTLKSLLHQIETLDHLILNAVRKSRDESISVMVFGIEIRTEKDEGLTLDVLTNEVTQSLVYAPKITVIINDEIHQLIKYYKLPFPPEHDIGNIPIVGVIGALVSVGQAYTINVRALDIKAGTVVTSKKAYFSSVPERIPMIQWLGENLTASLEEYYMK